MGYLLDTHTLLWYLLDDENLSENARKMANFRVKFHSVT